MSRRKKSEIIEIPTLPEEVVPVKEEPKIPFVHWFDKMLKKGRVRHYQDEALLVYFKKQGLGNIEIEERYDRAFETF